MLTALSLVLAALVAAKVVLHYRNAVPVDQFALDVQIYKLKRAVAQAKEDEAFREMRAIARGKR
jgi:hypothetical protein